MLSVPSLTTSQEIYLREVHDSNREQTNLLVVIQDLYQKKDLAALKKVFELIPVVGEVVYRTSKSLIPIMSIAHHILKSVPEETDVSPTLYAYSLISQRLIVVPEAIAAHPCYHPDIEEILFAIHAEVRGGRFPISQVVGRYVRCVFAKTPAKNRPIHLIRKSATHGIVANSRGEPAMMFTHDLRSRGQDSKKHLPAQEAVEKLKKLGDFVPALKLSATEKQHFICLEVIRQSLCDPYQMKLFNQPVITEDGETYSHMHTSLRAANPDFGGVQRPNHLIYALVFVISDPKPLDAQIRQLWDLFICQRTGVLMENPLVASTGFSFDQSAGEGGILNRKAIEVLAILKKYTQKPF